MADYRLTRFQDDEPEENLFDVEVIDTFNRFGRHAVAYIDDTNGDRSDKYGRGTGVTIEVDPDMSESDTPTVFDWTFDTTFVGYANLFRGFVMEADEKTQNGSDQIVLTIYSFDHFLRRTDITRDFTGETIFDALQEIIQDFTPVTWEPANVQVENNQTLSRSFRGEKVDNAISEFASKSGNEEFGVNNDIEFFFRPRETDNAPRDIAADEWFDFDFPEENAEALNEVQLYYGEGESAGSVIVDRGGDKQAIEDSLGLAGPATFREEVTREDIDTQSDAREKAEEILQDRQPAQIGEVMTFGLFDAEPGDLINVDIPARDIDDEFRIVELRYEWANGWTVAKLVENRGQQADTLIRLSDTLDRVESRAADRDATATRYVDTDVSATLSVELEVAVREFGESRFIPGFGRDSLGFGRSDPGLSITNVERVTGASSKATNTLLDALRDGWQGDGNPTIDALVIGDGSETPSRTDTTLANQTDSLSASATPSGTTVAQWSASFNPQTMQEAGIVDGSDDLYARATLSESVSPDRDIDVTLTITVSNDANEDGVVTDDGQESTRDIMADNSPDLPANIAFGSDDTMPTESDTALGNEVTRETIDTFTDRSVGIVDVVADIAADAQTGETIAEVGEASNGDLLTHSTFAEFVIEAAQMVENRDRVTFANE